MLTCVCGHKMRVSEFQLGMEMACPQCKRDIEVSEDNTAPIETKGPPPKKEPYLAGPGDGARQAAADAHAFAPPDHEQGGAPQTDAFAFSHLMEDEPAPKSPAGGTSGFAKPGDFSPYSRSAAANEAPQGQCSRCGRAFRGDWDIHRTNKGALCNICFNRAADDLEERPQAIDAAPPPGIDSSVMGVYEDHSDTIARERAPKSSDMPAWMAKHEKAWRAAIGIAAAIVVALGMYYAFFDTAPPPSERVVQQQGEAIDSENAAPAETAPLAIVIPVQAVMWLLGMIAPLYITLVLVNKLPHDNLLFDAIHVFGVSLLLAIVGTFTSFVPLVGFVIFIVFAAGILFYFYEFGLYQLFMFIILSVLLAPFLVVLNQFVMGSLALLF